MKTSFICFLVSYLKKASKKSSKQVKMGSAKHRKIFTDEMEKDLAEHCINLVKQHHDLSMDKVKMLAYEFAEKKTSHYSQKLV